MSGTQDNDLNPIHGTAGDDTIQGTPGDDLIFGGDGDDLIFGGDGDDWIKGGEGDDTIYGGDGDDTLWGQEGNDIIHGGKGDDLIVSGDGDDTVYGGEGNDEIYAGPGDDVVHGGPGDDDIYGNEGNDTLYGGDGNDKLDGGEGDDYLDGGDGDNILRGGDGNDTLVGGSGTNLLYGEDDADLFIPQPGDFVFGGDGGHDHDTLDLRHLDNYRIDGLTPDSDGNGWDGSVTLLDEDDNPTGETIYFENIEEFLHRDGYPGGPDGTVEGTDGDDIIDVNYTGDPDGDMVDGNDAILPGHSGNDDLIMGYGGNDTIFAGEGNDTIYAGTGNNYVDAGSGDDTIHGATGDDTLIGGDGDDWIHGGSGDDTIFGDDGDDFLHGGKGDDVIFGGDGNDTIHGGSGNDTLFGGDGDDILYGGKGDDTIFGDAGDDVIHTGSGDNTVFGGDGNDTIHLGDGVNTVFGGADRDVIIGGTAGSHVDGGSTGDDWDTLDLRDVDFDRIEYTSDDMEDGIVWFGDGSYMTFVEIENIIPCFTPGTMIATPRGERAVEELKVGDRIITRDNGIQEIRWVGHKEMAGKAMIAAPHLRPVMIRAGALGNGLPERDMMVSPNHRMLVSNERTQLYFEESEVLAAAKHLTGAPGIGQVDVLSTTYVHFMFDRHEVVLSNGAWSESFQPGDWSLKGVGNAQRSEIFELFPELKTREGREGYQAARKTLKKHEARLLAR